MTKKTKRTIIQKDRKGNVLDVFGSMATASRATGVPYSGIAATIGGKQKSSGGFIWECCIVEEDVQEKIASAEIRKRKKIILKPGETLCCYCDTCSPECPWKRCFKPVEGWKAKLNAKGTSYIVSKCPLYTDTNERGRAI